MQHMKAYYYFIDIFLKLNYIQLKSYHRHTMLEIKIYKDQYVVNWYQINRLKNESYNL